MSADPRYAERIVHLVNKHWLFLFDRQWLIEKAIRIVLTVAAIKLTVVALGYWDQFVPWR
jgi:hypothetical protein